LVQSFRTEGIAPLEWNFLDGRYLKAISKQFGQVPIRPWKPDNPGFNLNLRELIYFTAVRRIRTVLPLYYRNYIRRDADQLINFWLQGTSNNSWFWRFCLKLSERVQARAQVSPRSGAVLMPGWRPRAPLQDAARTAPVSALRPAQPPAARAEPAGGCCNRGSSSRS
jgi:hypothetical protein